MKRFTLASRATPSMFAVDCVCSRSKVTPAARRSRMIPTRWIMAEQPSTEAGSASGSRTSPGTRSMDSKPLSAVSEPGRTRHRTRKPWANSARTTACPTKPVAPVTKIRCMRGDRSMQARDFPGGPARRPRYDGSMLWRAAAFLAALLLLPALAAADSLDWSDLDRAALDAVAAGDAPGAVILVGQGDRILYRKAVGSRAVAPATEPMTTDTIFDIASLTKVVATTPAILALVD